jgi:hypothetical protein
MQARMRITGALLDGFGWEGVVRLPDRKEITLVPEPGGGRCWIDIGLLLLVRFL